MPITSIAGVCMRVTLSNFRNIENFVDLTECFPRLHVNASVRTLGHLIAEVVV